MAGDPTHQGSGCPDCDEAEAWAQSVVAEKDARIKELEDGIRIHRERTQTRKKTTTEREVPMSTHHKLWSLIPKEANDE